MSRKQTRNAETWGEIAHLLAYGPPPKEQKQLEVVVSEEILPEEQEQGEGITIRIMARKSWNKPRGKGQSPNVWYPHLSRENPEIKKYSDDPLTAARWCLVRAGEFYQPKHPNRTANPRWMEDLGNLRECRTALTLLVLDPPITHFAVCPPDGEMVTFPVDPEAKPIELERADNGSDTHSPAEVPTGAPEVNSGASSLGGENAI